MGTGLEERRVLATASGAGIGRAIALRLLSGGAHVLATDIDERALETLRDEAGGDASRLETARLDATDEGAVAQALDRLPDINGLYNGVGWVHEGTLLDTDREAWDRSWLLNVTAMYATTRAALPRIVENGGGPILCMASVAGPNGIPNRLAYSVTKAAVLGFAKSVAADYIKQGIRVNSILPGTVDSPSLRGRIENTPDPEATRKAYVARQPIGRLGKPEEIAELAAFLLSDHSAYVTGSEFTLDGGLSL